MDKTELIQALVKTEPAEITLFTRPRRFEKTLVMSMLASFFDIRRDSRDLFEGLKIAEDQKLCELWMNKWPVNTENLSAVLSFNAWLIIVPITSSISL